MPWQDITLTITAIALNIALLPSVFQKDKPAFITSLCSGFLFLVNSFVIFTLGLTITAVTIFIKSLLWLTLAAQKYRLGHHKIPRKK